MATKKLSNVCAGTLSHFMKSVGLAKRLNNNQFMDAISKTNLAKSKYDSFMGILSEVFLNGLLSGTGTPLINLVSGFTQSLLMPAVQVVRGVSTGNKRLAKEALAMYTGSIKGFADFIPFLKEGWAKGLPLDLDITDPKRLGMSKAEYDNFLSNLGLGPNSSPDQIRAAMGDAYDYVNKEIPGPIGEVIRVPSRLLVAIDEGMKAVFRRQKFHAQAMRRAQEIADKEGGDARRIYNELTTGVELYGEKADDAWKAVKSSDDLSKMELSTLFEAQDYAKMAAFQQELIGAAKRIQGSRAQIKPLIFMLPFFKTPYNILKEGLTFVPGVGYATGSIYKAVDSTGDKVRFRSMPKDELIARQMIGFGMAATAMTLMDQGLITGGYPNDPAKRQTMRDAGIPEFSIKVGDTWVSYRKIEPLSTVMGLVADLSSLGDEVLDDPEMTESDLYWERVGNVTWALKQNIFGKSFMEGLANAINLASFNDLTGGSGAIEQAVVSIGKGLVPYSALLNNIAVTLDSPDLLSGTAYDRQATTIAEKLKQRIPGLRETLPLMYGVFGEEKTINIMDIWTGIKTVDEVNRTELQEEIGLIGVAFAPVDKRITQGLRLDNENLATLRQYSAEFANLFMEPLIEGDALQNYPDSYKEQIFKKVMRRARKAAMRKFVAEQAKDPAFIERYKKAMIYNKGLQDMMGYSSME